MGCCTLARVAVPKIITLAVTIGTRFPALQTSPGKVLLVARSHMTSVSACSPSPVTPAPRLAGTRTRTSAIVYCARYKHAGIGSD